MVFEICPTSNVLTGAVKSLAEHPIKQLYDSGVSITINTDDPTVCGITLADECELAAAEFGFTQAEIAGMMQVARDAAFV